MSISLDGVLVKKGHQQETFTREQLEDFAACADPKTGPIYFTSNYFNIVQKCQNLNFCILNCYSYRSTNENVSDLTLDQ